MSLLQHILGTMYRIRQLDLKIKYSGPRQEGLGSSGLGIRKGLGIRAYGSDVLD